MVGSDIGGMGMAITDAAAPRAPGVANTGIARSYLLGVLIVPLRTKAFAPIAPTKLITSAAI